MGKIAILSHIVIDEIHEPGVAQSHVAVGGAGAYAAVGASLVRPQGDSAIVSGVGDRDHEFLASWCEDRGIDPRGLFVVSDSSPRTRIEYFADGERVETPVFGLEHFDAHTPLPMHIPFAPADLSGVYLFHDHGSEYWQHVAELRPKLSVPLMWEISAASCSPESREIVLERAAAVDIFSVNRTEALGLFGATSTREALASLRSMSGIILLRLGPEGAIVLEHGRTLHVGTDAVDVVDPTGGGNSFSGAFLAAYASSGNVVQSAQAASAAAAAVIAAPGAPVVDDERRLRVVAAARSISVTTE